MIPERVVNYWRVVGAIALRGAVRTYRRPQLLMPMFLVPTMFLAVVAGGAARAVDLPGFPQVESYFQFALAGAILQSTMLGGLMVGTGLSIDVDSGFFDRMIASPVARSALVVGRLAAGSAIAVAQALLYLTVGVVFGAHIEAGFVGIVIVCLLAALTALAVGGLSVTLALRAQAQWVQGAFPLVFVVLFLSSSFFPRALMTGPAKAIADYNPMSFVVEGMRNPIISSIAVDTLVTALATGVAVGLATTSLAIFALNRRFGATR